MEIYVPRVGLEPTMPVIEGSKAELLNVEVVGTYIYHYTSKGNLHSQSGTESLYSLSPISFQLTQFVFTFYVHMCTYQHVLTLQCYHEAANTSVVLLEYHIYQMHASYMLHGVLLWYVVVSVVWY
jgi:hypothetical protein